MAKKYPKQITYNNAPGRPRIDGTRPDEPAEDPTVYLQTKVPLSLRERLKAKAEAAGRTMSDVVRELVEQYCDL